MFYRVDRRLIGPHRWREVSPILYMLTVSCMLDFMIELLYVGPTNDSKKSFLKTLIPTF